MTTKIQQTEAFKKACIDEWNASADVREEFGGSLPRFIAYKEGVAAGRIKIIQGGQVSGKLA